MSESLYKTVEGPQGKADVYEVVTESPWQIAYEVRFRGQRESYATEGEAVIQALSACGMKDPLAR